MKALLVDENKEEDDDVFEAGGDWEPIFDTEHPEEEILTGDDRENLVVKRSYMTPRAVEEDLLRTNIFQSTYTILGKVCRFMINSSNRENIISTEVVQKLGKQLE